jgi:predicted phosphodiesterase
MGNHDYRFKENKLRHLGEEARTQLTQMPFRLDIQFGDCRIRIYHATPESRESFALERAGEETFRALFGEEGAGVIGEVDIVVLGHTHKPYVRNIGGTRFINPGALGLPEEEPPSFCVVSQDGSAEIVYLEEDAPDQ